MKVGTWYAMNKTTKSTSPTCIKCRKRKRTIRHHVTYKPELVVRICARCHTKITVVNTIAAVILGKKLSNELRLALWVWFLKYSGLINERVVANALGVEFEFRISHMLFIAKTKQRMITFEKTVKCKKWN